MAIDANSWAGLYADDQNTAGAYKELGNLTVGDHGHQTPSPFPARLYPDDTSGIAPSPSDREMSLEEILKRIPKPSRANRSPANLVFDDGTAKSERAERADMLERRASGNPDYFQESLSDDNRLGEAMAKERYQEGAKNPWDLKSAARDYMTDLGLNQMDLPVQPPHIKRVEVTAAPKLEYTGIFGTTQFLPESAISGNSANVVPFNGDVADMRIAPDTTPAERLLTIRHELQHVKEFDQNYKQRGDGGINPWTGLDERYGGEVKDHFIIGDTPEMERSFVKRPWMQRP